MAIKTVISTGGNWNTTTTWEPGGIPVSTDYVVFGATSGNITIPTNYSATIAGLEVNPAYTGTFSHNGSSNLLTISGTTASLILQPNLKLVRSGSPFMVTFNPSVSGTIQTNGLTLSNFWSIQANSGATISLVDGATCSPTNAILGAGFFTGGDINLFNIINFTPPTINLRAPYKIYIKANTSSTITHTNAALGQSHYVYDIPPSVNYSIPAFGIRLNGFFGCIVEFLQRPNFIGAGTFSGLPLLNPVSGTSSVGSIFDGTDTLIMTENFTWGAVSLLTPNVTAGPIFQEKRYSFPKGLSTSQLIVYQTTSTQVNRYSTASIISSGGTITASNVQLVGQRNSSVFYLGTASNSVYLRLSPDNTYVFGDLQSSTYPSVDNAIMSITPSVPVNITITGETGIVNTELRDINLANKRVLVGDSVTLTRSTGFINNINTSYTYIN